MSNRIPQALAILSICTIASQAPLCSLSQGTVVKVSITVSKLSEVTSTRVLVGDQVIDNHTMPVKMSKQQQFDYRDRFLKIKGAEIRSVEREFVKARSEYNEIQGPSAGGSEIKDPEKSLLEGLSIRFDWDSKLEGFTVDLPEMSDANDLAQLQDVLKPSFSPAFLSPSRASKSTPRWPVPVAELRDLLLAPGGDLFGLTTSDTPPGRRFVIRQQRAYLDSLAGDIQAQVLPQEEGQDPGQVRVSITGKLSSSFSVLFAEDELATRQMTESVEITGVAIWNKTKDRLESITLDAIGEDRCIDDISVEDSSRSVPGKREVTVAVNNHWDFRCSYEVPHQAK